jgi:phosphomannomutase
MIEASSAGAKRVVGYEANGGFLIHSDLELNGRMLRALPTRDAVILIVAILLFARLERKTVAELVRALPSRYTASDRLVDFPTEQSEAILSRFDTGDEVRNRHAIESAWGTELGSVKSLDRTDGLRMTFESGEIVHLRASGNAPEFRCYTEASSEARARELNQWCLDRVRRLKVGSREVGGESRLL